MNTLSFLAGAGVGAVIVTLLFVVLIHRLVGQRSADTKKVMEQNLRSVEALEKRNEIGEHQGRSLRKIAEWCEHNWSRP